MKPRSFLKYATLGLLLAVVFVFVSLPASAAPTNYYADAVNGNDANDGLTTLTAKKTIQAAIDAASAGDQVRVLPGSYDETATNRDVLGSGNYQFGLFFEDDAKDGVTLMGVTAADVAITDPAATEAVITTNATNNFGFSGIFVEADDVTISGLEIGNNTPGNNKTIEVIGDAFTFEDSYLNVSDGGSLYFGDWRFDTGTDTSYMLSYTVDGNIFSDGSSIDITSGAGYSGATANKLITNNEFEFSLAMYTASGNLSWPSISFTGDTTDVPWFVHPMTGATITGNTFDNHAPDGRHIRARGIADDSTFDWESYWNDNTFNKAVIVGPDPFDDVRSYSYVSGAYNMNDTRHIGAAIQQEVNNGVSGDTVLIAPGTYPENVTLPKSLTLSGAGNGTNPAEDTILEGTGRNGSGIYINNNVIDVTVENLRVQNYNLTPAAGVYANAGNNGLTVQNVTSVNNGHSSGNGGGIYMNGPVDDVLITGNTITNNRTRGIVIWNGFKTNITITDNTVTGNNCCGIELQDGTASGVTVTGNTVTGNVDSGMAFTGLMAGAGPNLIADNTVTNNGRFGIEIKLPNGTGLDSGDGSIVVEDNDVSLSPAGTLPPTEERDIAGIAVMRRGFIFGNANGNANIPTGVIVRDNTVSGYQQNNASSDSTGFGIVVEGTNMHVSGNTLNNNDVGVQVQAGHTPYTGNGSGGVNPPDDGNQTDLPDNYFGRGNSPIGCAALDANIFSGNTVDSRNVNAGGGNVTNVDTGEHFCSIQAAVNDSDTVNSNTIEVSAGTYAESVTVNKSLTINGANAGVSPNDATDPLLPNAARGPESEVTVTGANRAFSAQAADVTIDGFKFTNTAVTALGDIQSPLIGVGWNYGGPGDNAKVLNNLFVDTSRILVYFNGPDFIQGGAIEDNRAENPTRATSVCGTGPLATPSGCGYQLFNPWATDGVSFQRNVTIADPASGDRVRTLNVAKSKNITIADNTVRYTCTYTCFTIAAVTSGDVEVFGNDLVTDVGNVIQIHNSWTTTGASVNVHHNILTTGNDFPIVVDNPTADLDNVHINRNAITGGAHVRNGKDDMSVEGAETLDVSCNWWGSVDGPNPAGFYGPADYTPWLFSADLNSDCYVPGTITVVKQTNPDGDTTQFTFDPSWGANFTLSDGQSLTSPALNPNDGPFSVAEINLPANWALDSSSCTNGTTTANPASIPLVDGEAWTCTFENDYTAPVGKLYLSPNKKKGNVGGVNFSSGDILLNILGTNNWSLYFDGDDVGLKVNLTDYVFLEGGPDDGCILMTFNGNFKVPGVWTFKPQDIAKFCPTSLGENNTTGTWSVYFDGSDVGLNAGAEKIDGLAMTDDGDLIISTKGNFDLKPANPMKGKKNDLLRFSPSSLGENTTGSWSLYFLNTQIPSMKKANPLSLDLIDDDIYMSVWGNYTLNSVAVDDNDIFIIHPDLSVTKFWDGALYGYTFRIMGLEIVYD